MTAKTTSYMTLTARVPRALGEQIKARAERAGTSPSETIRALLSRALNDTERARTTVGPAQIERIEKLTEIAARYAAEVSESARISARANGRESTILDAQRFAARVLAEAQGDAK